MNKIVKYGIGGFLGLSILGAILPKGTPTTQGTKAVATTVVEDNSKQIAAIEKALKKEPKIKDLMRHGDYWNVGLISDGTPRYGYAEYVCNVIRDGGAMNASGSTIVRTVNIVSVVNGDSPREASMGAVDCSDFSHQDR